MESWKEQTMDSSGKYVRYTNEQVEALERVYHECPKPSSIRRHQLIKESPILANIEPKQIKVWFQNRRCREKQRKEATRLVSVNAKLTALNKLLMEENERLAKHASQLTLENHSLRQQLPSLPLTNGTHRLSSQNLLKKERAVNGGDESSTQGGICVKLHGQAGVASTDTSCDSAVTGGLPHHLTPRHSPRYTSPAGLLATAEETLTEFLAKATGTAVDWIQLPGMKPGPDAIGIIAISHGCVGIAARACGLVALDAGKVTEVLKDRPAWLEDCRRMEVLGALPTGNRGTIELLYTQMYASTTLAPARDYCTLRYTTILEDGNLVICERSLTGGQNGPSMPPVQSFVRGEMFPSGYLIRPCDGGGCIIHVVDHYDNGPWSVPEVLRPLYESPAVLAQRSTIAALRHLRRLAAEESGEGNPRNGQHPAVLRTLGQRLAKGFKNAVNGFADDGWVSTVSDGLDDVSVILNATSQSMEGQIASDKLLYSLGGGILCAKASMLLQNVPPSILIKFLREHRSEWADYDMDANLATSFRSNGNGYAPQGGGVSHVQLPLPLPNSGEHGEILEVVKLEDHSSAQPPPPPPPPPPPLPTLSCRKFINLPAPDDPMKLTPPPSPPSNPHEERKLTPPVSPECPQDGRKITPPPSPIPPFPTLPRKSVTPPPSPPPPVMPSSASKPKLAALILPGRPDLGADNVEGFRINRRSPKQPQKMRPLHWEKLKPESHKSMVWDNITNSMELDEEMIEHMFGVTTRASEDEGPKQSASTVTIERAEMLYPRKAHNIAIQLRARGLSRIEVRNALLEGEGLSQEILELLVKMAPTDDEMTKFQGYHGDPTLLGPADRFVQGILQIPSAFERLNSMLYRASFSEELTQLQCTITTLEMACKELKSSRTFTKLLEAVLKTGNRLNTGTFRGDAKAFKLDTLLKLADVKGVDGKTTLLHFLIKEIVKAEAFRAARLAGFHDSSTPSSTWSSLCPSPTCTSPSSPLSHFARGMEAELNRCQSEISNSSSLGGFRRIGMDVVRGIPNELDHVRKAGGMDISTIRLGVSRLQTGLQDMKTTLEKLHEPSEGVGIGIRTTTYDLTDDVFSDRMAGFVEDAEAKLSVIQKDLEIVLASAKDISVYFYGEADTAKSTQPLKVFMVMRDFLAMLEQACEDVMKGNAPLPPPSTGPSRRNSLTLPM